MSLADSAMRLPEVYRSDAVKRKSYEVILNDESEIVTLFYRGDMSNLDYTKHTVYDVMSTIDSWGGLKRAIRAILKDDSMSYGEYRALNDREPSLGNHLRRHFKYEPVHVDGLVDGDVMRYTIIEPYDD